MPDALVLSALPPADAAPPLALDNGALSSAPDSPLLPSPFSTAANSPAVNIEGDDQHRETSAHDLNISLNKIDAESTRPQLASPQDPDSIPISHPNGTPPPPLGHLLEDVQMAEANSQPQTNGFHHDEVQTNGLVNGHGNLEDMKVDVDGLRENTQTPPLPNDSSLPDFAAVNRSSVDDADQPPPAKRARKLSDAEQASVAHSPAPQPPTTAVNTAATTPNGHSFTSSPTTDRKTSLSHSQWRFCVSTIRHLRKLKDASPFLNPVDAIALNIPHYPTIVKHPMDFSTIERKLSASNPQKPEASLDAPRYYNADEYVADVRRVFTNCALFNGPDHAITQMGKRVEGVFDKQIKQMPPPAEEAKPVVPKKQATPPPPPPLPAAEPDYASKKSSARRPSTSVPTIRRNDTTESGRVKREIHPPPPRDLPYTEPPKKQRAASTRKTKRVPDGTSDQLKFCQRILSELFKKQHWNIANVFYDPVDWVKLNLPTYPKIVKKPMDLSTMRKKLDGGEYPTALAFQNDFELMIKNCMAFNPAGTHVHNCGVELRRLFYEKWANLPPLKVVVTEDEEEDEEESEDENAGKIANLESQIEIMKANIERLKNEQKKKEKKKKPKEVKKRASPVASSSKPNGKESTKRSGTSKKQSSKKSGGVFNSDVLSFEQKKELSETIQNLDGDKLERVIQIIHDGVPEVRDSTEEIELDIDQLPGPVLQKLYNFVILPLRQTGPKRKRTGTGTGNGGTGGLKRKSMDEDVEAEKIRQLEERMKMFDKNSSGGGMSLDTKLHHHDSDRSSVDDSSDDSSGSDSE